MQKTAFGSRCFADGLYSQDCERRNLTKMLRVMKLTIVLLTAAFLQIQASGISQSVTLSGKNMPLTMVFEAIHAQTGYLVFGSQDMLKDAKPVTLAVSDMPLIALLDLILRDQPLAYDIKGETIRLSRKVALSTVDIPDLIPITGTVRSPDGKPLAGATVRVKGKPLSTLTDETGAFLLNAIEGDIFIISFIGFDQKEVRVKNGEMMAVVLSLSNIALDTASVILNTGYQTVDKTKTTGSFAKVDNALLNRSVSTNILDRLKGTVPGLLFDASLFDFNSETSQGFSIRGRSTIFGNTNPLIVVDNFAYDGDLSTINPNDVESITVLKDAASAAIWGVRASNGVIVITTKRGTYNQRTKITVNSNVTVGQKPDLYAQPDLTPSQIIDVESYLFDKGRYDDALLSPSAYLSPVVQILANKQNGQIMAGEAQQQIDALRTQNYKSELLNYYYRRPVNQQYSINLSGGASNNAYYLSVGYDKNLNNIVNTDNDRLTISSKNTYALLNKRLQLTAGIDFSAGKIRQSVSNLANPSITRPYTQLADASGNYLNITTYKKSYLDTIGGGKLLDWTWTPLKELDKQNSTDQLINYLLNAGLQYNIIKGLDVNLQYQYSKGNTESTILYTPDLYYTRDLINQYSQINYTAGSIQRPIPVGNIFKQGINKYSSHNVRGQLNFNRQWNSRHQLSVLAGSEVKVYDNRIDNATLYGYDEDMGTVAAIDYATYYTNLVSGFTAQIPGGAMFSGTADRYISLFSHVQYSFKNTYQLTASLRKDESNLFGVKANQKGVPLWSAGIAWIINNEPSYKIAWMPLLKLRITTGYNGNVDKTISAYTTAGTYTGQTGLNSYNSPFAYLINPPNPSLRWEKIQITNIGIDFSLLQNRISGSMEYWKKTGKDIIGNSPLAPSTGVSNFKGNSANISGNGIDIAITTENTVRAVKWSTVFIFSKAIDKITDYKVKSSALSFHVGYPYNGLFSYRWGGLSAINGDPQGWVNGKTSTDWAAINIQDSLGKNTIYSGSGTPVYFGSIRNTINYKNFSFSFNIIYKLGYYFRQPSISYTDLYSSLKGHIDYNNRWIKPGDEQTTHVPSALYPASISRDIFYQNSEILVQKGDHLRLQDINLSYDLHHMQGKSALKNVRVYLYANNLGLLWKANNNDIDPESPSMPIPKTISVGIQAGF